MAAVKRTPNGMEKRWRVTCDRMYHPQCDCFIVRGEDFNMVARDRTSEEQQFYLDNRYLEIYYAPTGTPHVVHTLGKREVCDPVTGEWSVVIDYTDAAKQWQGETVFISEYVPDEVTKE